MAEGGTLECLPVCAFNDSRPLLVRKRNHKRSRESEVPRLGSCRKVCERGRLPAFPP